MRLHFTSIPIVGGEAEAKALDGFLASHRIVGVDRELVHDGRASRWAICVQWEPSTSSERGHDARKRSKSIDYRAVRPQCRYMDDILWWCDTRHVARRTLAEVRAWLVGHRRQHLRADAVIGRSRDGVSFLGTRVRPGSIRLGRRRRRRYMDARRMLERAWSEGRIDTRELQMRMASVIGSTTATDSAAWRAAELRRRPAVDA